MPIRRLPPRDRQPHRRRRGGRAAGERGQGAGRERHRRGARRIEVQADGGGLCASWSPTTARAWRPEELPLALERHATSKLAPDADGEFDLLHIATLGFRGEALPSIGSVARLALAPRAQGAARRAPPSPATPARRARCSPAAFAGAHGARVEVRDLFYATPARLKFMKSERAEAMAIAEEVKRQAMAHEEVAFALDLDGRRALRLAAEAEGPAGRLRRLAAGAGRRLRGQRAAHRPGAGRRAAFRLRRACRPTRAATRPTSTCS